MWPAPVYVFNHIPRTAGGALGKVLAHSRRVAWDYPGPGEGDLERWLRNPIDLGSLSPGDVLMGHFTAPGGRLHERYPGIFRDDRYRLIVFLRDPWEHLCSHVRHFGNEGRAAAPSVAGLYGRTLRVPPRTAREALTDYWFVGVTEHAQACCDVLARALGHAPRELPQENRSKRDVKVLAGGLFRQDLLELARTDYELYREAQARWAEAEGMKQ
jgi:hypothetical protein